MQGTTPDDDNAHTPLSDDERQGLIPQHIASRSELNQWESVNIAQCHRWLSRQRAADVLQVQFLCALHRRMFDHTWTWAGTDRRSDNNISPFPWHAVPVMIRELVDNTRVRYDAIDARGEACDEIAIHFHHQLVRIHPWPNGNGRHARLAADLLLGQWGRPAFSWGSGSDLAGENTARERYIAALRSADQGDMSALRTFCRS
ncbi:MAG: mobile mystery protein B [Gemmatimonadota bacterium]|nr:mobile mystery protein B [Gemmatimonadota bacterium]